MNLFVILLSCAFVNVLAVTMREYKQKVFLTNHYLQQIHKKGSIEKLLDLVIGGNQHSMGDLAILFVVPEYAEPNHLTECSILHDHLKRVIKYDLEIELQEPSDEDFQTCSLIELGSHRRIFVKEHIRKKLNRALIPEVPVMPFDQFCLYLGLLKCTGYPGPYIIDADTIDDKCVLHTNYGAKETYSSIKEIRKAIKRNRYPRE